MRFVASVAVAEQSRRVAAETNAVRRLRKQIEGGDYNIAGDDPHLPASLLKQWLRGLEEPLIPTTF